VLTKVQECPCASYGGIELHKNIHRMVVSPNGTKREFNSVFLFKREKRDAT
jgi:hypothetical protein